MDSVNLFKQLSDELAAVQVLLNSSKASFLAESEKFDLDGGPLAKRAQDHVSGYCDESRARFIRAAARETLTSLRKFPSQDPFLVRAQSIMRLALECAMMMLTTRAIDLSEMFETDPTGDPLKVLNAMPAKARRIRARNLLIFAQAIELCRVVIRAELLAKSAYQNYRAILQLYLGEGDRDELIALIDATEDVVLEDFKSEATDLALEVSAEILEVSIDTIVPVWRLFRIARAAHEQLTLRREDMFQTRGDLDDMGDLSEMLDRHYQASCDITGMLRLVGQKLSEVDDVEDSTTRQGEPPDA